MELDQVTSPPTPPQGTPADDEPEQEDAQEAVASERDEPDSAVQTRQGLSPAVVITTITKIPNQSSHRTGKRKADAEADPKREKKKSREISEPLEESEPEPGKVIPDPLHSFPNPPPFFFPSANKEATRNHLRGNLPRISDRYLSPP